MTPQEQEVCLNRSLKASNDCEELINKLSIAQADCAMIKEAIDDYIAKGRPHGGKNSQFPDGCECEICENWDTLNKDNKFTGIGQSLLDELKRLRERV